MKEDQTFFVGQKAFIEKDGKVLILKERNGVDMPGGKIQAGEMDLSESLRREVREETGIEIEVGKPFFVWQFELPTHHRDAGKKVFLVAYRATYLAGEIRLSDEHTEYMWVSRGDYQTLRDDSGHFMALETYFSL